MPYQSRFSAVLLQRQYKEEDAYRTFVDAKHLLETEQEHLRLLDKKIQATLDHLTERQERLVSAEELSLYFRFIARLRERVADQTKTVFHQEEVCEEKRVILDRAVKERKAVETIEEKRKKEYLKVLFKKEQAVLDEIGGQLQLRHPHG